MKSRALFLALFFVFFAIAVSAQTATPGVRNRQNTQQKRIVKGAKEGELDKKEVKKLERQQRSINRSKRRAKADGEVTKGERAKLRARQNRAGRDIKRAKKN
jgi:hypothetical protein